LMVKKVRHNGIYVATAENGKRKSPILPFNALSRRVPMMQNIGETSGGPSNPQPDTSNPPKVSCRITAAGYYYRQGETELGPFTLQDHYDPKFEETVGTKLNLEPEHVSDAYWRTVERPITFSEINEALGSTIRHDVSTKLILFCGCLLTFTDEDQVNILMAGESSGGKTYNALEVVAYFRDLPKDLVLRIATASPTAFFHDHGKWDKEAQVLRIDLRQKILVFLDQPHYSLLERLRPLMSHDQKELLYKITDKSTKGPMRTKNVILEGYPTVILCAAKLSLDEQEKTRVFILSPETSVEKLQESLQLAVKRVGDRQAFREWINSHPLRKWLRDRIEAIQTANVKQVIIEDQEQVYQRFVNAHKRLAPRHQRDLPRILSLIKAHALLNLWWRDRRGDGTIVANQEDVNAGFELYNQIAKPNELGLSPQIYEVYETIIKPLLDNEPVVDRRRVLSRYFEHYGRHLAGETLRREIVPALIDCGLVVEQPDPSDRRRKLLYPPDAPPIPENGTNVVEDIVTKGE